jgi:hypothetical protein
MSEGDGISDIYGDVKESPREELRTSDSSVPSFEKKEFGAI